MAAANLCAVIYMNGKVAGRYAMPAKKLREALVSRAAEVEAAIDEAVERGWVCRQRSFVELKAGGIYTAKNALDLPR